MDKDFSEKIATDEKLRLGLGALLLVGIFVFSLGVGFFYFGSRDSASDIKIISSDTNESESEIIVHVDGAVANPGVYTIKNGARISDAVTAAGGLLASADSAKINLAARITDGQKVLIPVEGATYEGSVAGVSVNGQINVNSASASDLEKLPGIGVVTAGKIIAARPFNSIEELMTKRAVTKSVYDKIKELVTVY